jgi:hypothetical protein
VTNEENAEKFTEPDSDSRRDCSKEELGSSGVRKSTGSKTCGCMGTIRQTLTPAREAVLQKGMDASGVEQQKTNVDVFEQFS